MSKHLAKTIPQEMLTLEDACASLDQSLELPSIETFVGILQECRNTRNLAYARKVHVHACDKGMEAQSELGNYLVPMFVECGSMLDAHRVFNRMSHQNEFSWTSLIQGYTECEEFQLSFDLFQKMQEGSVCSSNYTFLYLLKACARLKCLEKGWEIHNEIVKESYERDLFVGNTLVDMYGKCGSLVEAQEVFNQLLHRNIVTWNTLITSYTELGFGVEALNCLEQMQLEGISPSEVTLFGCLKACSIVGAVSKGREIHAESVKEGYETDPLVCNTLVDLYGKCGLLVEARKVFDDLPVQDVVSWTALIAGYVEHGHGKEALSCLEQMRFKNMSPDAFTYACSLRACGSIGAVDRGQEIHSEMVKEAFERDPFVCSSLVDMYGKLGLLSEAWQVLDKLHIHDTVSWNTLIGLYAEQGLCEEALNCLEKMRIKAIPLDAITFVCCLQACSSLGAINRGQELHVEILKKSFERDLSVGNTLVDMYAKYGLLAEAQKVFDMLPVQDVVSWTALMAGYVEDGHSEEALSCFQHMLLKGVAPNAFSWNTLILGYSEQGEIKKAFKLYGQMQEQGLVPNEVTFLNILKGCGNTAALEIGKKIHIQCNGVGRHEITEASTATAIVDMYGKCGSMIDAQQVFDVMPMKDQSTWTALITGYARQGESELVFRLFGRMRKAGIQPDEITFVSILSVCTHAGLLEEGYNYFVAMNVEFGITPCIEHHNCMVDVLSRAGQLQEAVALLEKVTTEPDFVMWSTMLGACRSWGDVKLGRQAFEFAVRLNEEHSAAYTLMSNTYTWEDAWQRE